MAKKGYVYIRASKRNGTLYVGVSSNMPRRDFEHKNKKQKSFTARYNVCILVYVEIHNNMSSAIAREKALKKWCRSWKIRLIEESNPEWKDLYPE